MIYSVFFPPKHMYYMANVLNVYNNASNQQFIKKFFATWFMSECNQQLFYKTNQKVIYIQP